MSSSWRPGKGRTTSSRGSDDSRPMSCLAGPARAAGRVQGEDSSEMLQLSAELSDMKHSLRLHKEGRTGFRKVLSSIESSAQVPSRSNEHHFLLDTPCDLG